MSVLIRKYDESDLAALVKIWNDIVDDGIAYPQTDDLTVDTAREFFAAQSYVGAAENASGEIVGMYILHPNNIGRCGHICNASFAVSKEHRGEKIGAALVNDCLDQAKRIGFGVMQFNAVVKTNTPARKLYTSLGFTEVGMIPRGFMMKDGHFEDIFIYYKEL